MAGGARGADRPRDFPRGVVQSSPQLAAAFPRRKRPVWVSWRMAATSVKVKGQWYSRDRAVDKTGQTMDFLLPAHRDEAAARRFLPKALRRPGVPETITSDGNAANAAAIRSDTKAHGTTIMSRQGTYRKNIVE